MFIVCFCVCLFGFPDSRPPAIALIVGLNVAAMSFISGGVFNPARAFGPAVVEGFQTSQWAYWVGPLVGGVAAALIFEYLFMDRSNAKTQTPSTAGDNHPKQD